MIRSKDICPTSRPKRRERENQPTFEGDEGEAVSLGENLWSMRKLRYDDFSWCWTVSFRRPSE